MSSTASTSPSDRTAITATTQAEGIKAVIACHLTESQAAFYAIDGLCGCISHLDDYQIWDCTEPKGLLIFLSDGAYSIVHLDRMAKWNDDEETTKETPIVLPSTIYSKA
ncbi:hypothetical protein LTR53_015888, partial [Teratosphaeriaceae sp. CCFEE 6253]